MSNVSVFRRFFFPVTLKIMPCNDFFVFGEIDIVTTEEGCFVKSTTKIVHTYEEARSVLKTASKNKKRNETELNSKSSSNHQQIFFF